ncbi:MAG TPA: hypothetical protein GXZ59_04225 [Clostridiaceae bacterium]|nr:hypothetical protein [Clostridiaceae bacterium]
MNSLQSSGCGGWPLAVVQSEQVALWQAFDYVVSIVESDISQLDGIHKDPARVRGFMRSYSRHVSTRAGTTKIHSLYGCPGDV